MNFCKQAHPSDLWAKKHLLGAKGVFAGEKVGSIEGGAYAQYPSGNDKKCRIEPAVDEVGRFLPTCLVPIVLT